MDFITDTLAIPVIIFNIEIQNFFNEIDKHKFLENHHKEHLYRKIIKEVIYNYLLFCDISVDEKKVFSKLLIKKSSLKTPSRSF